MPITTVHPRACGERAGLMEFPVDYTGSSPRVRGTLPWRAFNRVASRFIPARAGNASTLPTCSWGCTVHPRACGERLRLRCHSAAVFGSSPRVRGTPTQTSGISHRNPVHPRACGERFIWSQLRKATIGSSPRVRGTHPSELVRPHSERFIPARAGNARSQRQKDLAQNTGSSPRVRGTHMISLCPVVVLPTAGSSPRVRGTLRNCSFFPALAEGRGSSPRVRGTLFSQEADI